LYQVPPKILIDAGVLQKLLSATVAGSGILHGLPEHGGHQVERWIATIADAAGKRAVLSHDHPLPHGHRRLLLIKDFQDSPLYALGFLLHFARRLAVRSVKTCEETSLIRRRIYRQIAHRISTALLLAQPLHECHIAPALRQLVTRWVVLSTSSEVRANPSLCAAM